MLNPNSNSARRVVCVLLLLCAHADRAAEVLAAQPPGDVEQRGLQQLIRETEEAIKAGIWLQATEKFDAAWELASQKEDPLLVNTGADVRQLRPGETEILAGGKARLEDLYRNSPIEFREEFRRQYSQLAEQRISEASANADSSTLRRMAVRYAFCPAARRGILTLAKLAADQGDFLEAALLLGRVRRHGDQPDPAIDLQAAYCYSRAGLTADADDMLAEIAGNTAAASVTIGGWSLPLPQAGADLSAWTLQYFGGSSSPKEFEWVQPGGSYRRFSAQARGPARFTKIWESDLFAVQDVLFAEHLNPVLSDFRGPIAYAAGRLQQMNSTIIPAASPLLVGDLAILRMPWGLRAVKVATGDLVWEVTRPDSRMKTVVELMAEEVRRRESGDGRGDSPRSPFRMMADPRGQLLYQMVRTNTASQMSVSGQTLFVCEESSGATWDDDFNTGIGPDRAGALPSNYIRAYDVETGVFQWEVGGQSQNSGATGGRANLLAGYYFLGAPLVLGRRTYVLAEGGEGLFLIQIGAPRSGDESSNPRILMSQLLTVPQDKLELARHPVRKHAGLIPSFAQGLLICPTCDERIVAVSAEDHSIRWMFRYAGNLRAQELGGDDLVLFGGRDSSDSKRVDLDSRWIDSLPRISDGRVLVTPRDSDLMYCLDLETGKELWNSARGPFHAIAAVTQDRVVLIGNQTVAALNIADGSPVWRSELREGVVCGTSASDGTLLQIPTSEPAIVTLDMATGGTLVTQALDHTGQPGNLLICDKGVLSQNLMSVQFTAFGGEPTTAADRAVKLLLNAQTPAAIDELEQHIAASTDSAAERGLLIQILLETLRKDFHLNRGYLPRVRELVAMEENDVQIAPLLHTLLGMSITDAAIISDQLRGRSDRWLGELSELVARGLMGSRTTPQDEIVVSISGLLAELPAAHGKTVASRFLARSKAVLLIAGIREAVRIRPAAEQADLQRQLQDSALQIARSLPPGTAGSQFVRDLAACAMPELALLVHLQSGVSSSPETTELVAELLRIEIAQSASAASTAAAIALLESWTATEDFTSVNAWSADVSGISDANTQLRFQIPDEGAKKEILSQWSEKHPEFAKPAVSVWGIDAPVVTVSPDRTIEPSTRLPRDIPNTLLPLFGAPGVFRGWSFVRLMDVRGQGDVAAFDADGVLRWTFRPLGAVDDSGFGFDRDSYLTATGHLVLLNLSGTLFALDTFAVTEDKKPNLLWQKNIERMAKDSESDIYRDYTPSADRVPQYSAQPSGFYPVAPASPLGVAVISGRRLTVLDPLTGDRKWQVDGIARDAVLMCSGDSVLVISEVSRQTEVRSLIDGTVRSTARLPDWWGDANANVGSSVRDIDVEEGVDLLWRIMLHDQSCLLFRLSSGKSKFECRDLLTDTISWSIELPQDSVFSNVAEDVVAVISEGRQLKLLHVDTGKVLTDLQVTQIAEPRELFLRSTHGHYIVLPEAVEDPSIELDPVLNSMHVHGRIWAINHENMQLAWEQPVEHQWIRQMSPERATILPNAPILVLISRGGIQKPDSVVRSTRYGTRVLDVRTGTELHHDKDVGIALNHHWLRMDAGAQKLELSFESRVVTLDYSPVSAVREK